MENGKLKIENENKKEFLIKKTKNKQTQGI